MHQLDFSNDRANIAFTGSRQQVWHGLGQELVPGADIETWRKAAGMNWHLLERPIFFQEDDSQQNTMNSFPEKIALVRSDTRVPLAIVSEDYNVVQPGEVLEFYRDIVATGGYTLDVAGCLFGGRRYWALAKINESAMIGGIDKVDGYILLATACDGTLATTAMITTTRVVCNNTLQIALHNEQTNNSKRFIKVSHSSTFDPLQVKQDLGLVPGSFAKFAEQADMLATRRITNKEAVEFLIKVMGDEKKPVEDQKNARLMKHTLELFLGDGMGSNLASANGTLWGLVNAVTEFNDHHRGTRSIDSRLNKTWFGDGATMKQKAWDEAMKLVVA